MDKLDMHIWSTTPAISDNIEELQAKINELIGEIEIMKCEISRCEKKYPNPQNRNPYDASRGGLKR